MLHVKILLKSANVSGFIQKPTLAQFFFETQWIYFSDSLNITEHVNNLVSSWSSLMCSLLCEWVLQSHGMPVPALHDRDVFRATVVAKVTYGAPAMSSMCSEAHPTSGWIRSLKRCKRLGFRNDITLSSLSQNSLAKLAIHFLESEYYRTHRTTALHLPSCWSL